MMQALAPFADLMVQTNAAVLQTLSNAIAHIGAGEPFGVMFETPYREGYGSVIDGRAPVCIGSAEKLGELERDDEIVIGGQLYSVESAEPDGDGFVRLQLIKGGE